MAIKLVTLKCPECGALLKVEEDRKQVFCSYCGAKIILDNDNEYISRKVDDAEIKHAETERMVELKKLEIAEKTIKERQKRHSLKVFISIILGIFSIVSLSSNDDITFGRSLVACLILLCMWVGELSGDTNHVDEDKTGIEVKVPKTIAGFQREHFVAIEKIFKDAGFTNVKCEPLGDLTTGLLVKPNTVESITINGYYIYSGGKEYLSDAPVIIYYHSFSN